MDENDKDNEERLGYHHDGCCDDYEDHCDHCDHYDHCDEYWESDDHCKYYGGHCCEHDDCPKKHKKYKKHKKHCC